ncbi:MAG: hypothetical protein M1135_02755 [Candidatus Omnitrophica bacterium]|nr:hypothetical protein [Candidatus Omnitrophota bacterium]
MNKSIFRIWNKLILSIFIFSFLHSAFCKPVNLSKIVYGDNQFVAIGWIGSYVKKTMRSIILTSTNGITWTKQNFETNQFLNGIVYGDKKFVAVGGYGTIITSSDGIHWSKQKIPK